MSKKCNSCFECVYFLPNSVYNKGRCRLHSSKPKIVDSDQKACGSFMKVPLEDQICENCALAEYGTLSIYRICSKTKLQHIRFHTCEDFYPNLYCQKKKKEYNK